MSDLKYFDAHTHIHFKEFDADIDEVLFRMKEGSVGAITVGVDLESSKRGVEFANKQENIWATVGQHPADNHTEKFDMPIYRHMVEDPKVVAIGECGLDYFRLKKGEEEADKKRQREVFEKQIVLAREVGKPLMIHCRDAHEDVIAMLKESGVPAIIHFFTGTIDEAKQYLELGCYLSFSGVVTFAFEYNDLVRMVPADRILTETDAPYATPNPLRGRRNEPAYVVHTLAFIAKLRGISDEEMRKQVLLNVSRAFPSISI